MKKILTVILTVLFMASGLLPVANPAKVEASSKPTTIFLHGYYGGKDSMVKMIRFLTNEKSNLKAPVPYEMTRNGKTDIYLDYIPYAGQKTTYYFTPPGYKGTTEMRIIDFTKYGAKKPNDKLVQVVFSQNAQSLDNQEKMLRQVLADLKKKNVKEINLVAHSMGGLLATQLVLKGSPIKVKNLVTLDSPILGTQSSAIGGSARDLHDGGAVIRESIRLKKKINSGTKVLSYSDSWSLHPASFVVDESSARGLEKLTVKGQFTFKKIEANHLSITSHKTVLNDVKKIAM